jgi:cobalt-zinc-cadmium efflux system membrane fusion protein
MTHEPRKTSWTQYGLMAVGCLAVGAAGWAYFGSHPTAPAYAAKAPTPVRLISGSIHTIELSSQMVNALGMRTVQVQSAATHEKLSLTGKLTFDPDRFVRIHSRFNGEVVALGSTEEGVAKNSAPRSLRVGDRVTKGQLLAVVSSKDIGEKKSDLVDALSSFYVHDAQVKKLAPLEDSVISGKQVREAERLREADVIEIDRSERTLRSWRVPEAEIATVRSEAEKIHRGEASADRIADKGWAKVEVRAPFEGTILEMNAVEGVMVDTALDLFKIADLTTLTVMANVYEEDLRCLESLEPAQRRWKIALNSQPNAPPIEGQMDRISYTVDPNLHTAMVRGWIDNRDGKLLAGLLITASIELPAIAEEVVVPDTALVEDGYQTVVFVSTDQEGCKVIRRNVAVVSRCQDVVYVRSQPTTEEKANGCESLAAGEWVVTAGSAELEGALDSLATTAQAESVKN